MTWPCSARRGSCLNTSRTPSPRRCRCFRLVRRGVRTGPCRRSGNVSPAPCSALPSCSCSVPPGPRRAPRCARRPRPPRTRRRPTRRLSWRTLLTPARRPRPATLPRQTRPSACRSLWPPPPRAGWSSPSDSWRPIRCGSRWPPPGRRPTAWATPSPCSAQSRPTTRAPGSRRGGSITTRVRSSCALRRSSRIPATLGGRRSLAKRARSWAGRSPTTCAPSAGA